MRFAAIVLVAVVSAAAIVAQVPAPRQRLLDTLALPVQYERVFDQRLAYYEAGPRSAPVVILIPSLGWDAHAWSQNVPALARSYRVIVLSSTRLEPPCIVGGVTLEITTHRYIELDRELIDAVAGALLDQCDISGLES